MNRNKTKFETMLMPVYLFVELCLLVIIKMTERQGHEGVDIDNVFMFIVILCNTAVILYYYFRYGKNRKNRHENLLVNGAVINLFSDFFLSLIDTAPAAIPGVALFCILESLYALYLKSPASSDCQSDHFRCRFGSCADGRDVHRFQCPGCDQPGDRHPECFRCLAQ